MMATKITEFTQGICDMYQAEGCALVCRHKGRKSHILLSQKSGKYKQATTTNIYGTLLCMTFQISFGIISKH